jgi:hypothetical protein
MDQQTKHEIVLIALSALVAVPVFTGLSLVVVSGIVAWQGQGGPRVEKASH